MRPLAPSRRQLLQLAAGARQDVQLAFPLAGVARGDYFLAVFPSDPGNGKRIGSGRYRVPVSIAE